jgi:RNA polymerase sigma-70 factor, ECF subfamily
MQLMDRGPIDGRPIAGAQAIDDLRQRWVDKMDLSIRSVPTTTGRAAGEVSAMRDEPSADLLVRWRTGDQRAADELFSRYTARLVAMTRRRLSTELGRRVDAEDVVQSAYRCFYAAARDGKVVLQRSGDLWRLLATITLHRLHHQVERHGAARRGVDRERTFGGESSLGALGTAAARAPSPPEVAAVNEDLELVLGALSPRHRRMAELRLQGYQIEEIARATDRSERLVRRVLDQVKDRLTRRCGAISGARVAPAKPGGSVPPHTALPRPRD